MIRIHFTPEQLLEVHVHGSDVVKEVHVGVFFGEAVQSRQGF
jgi:hypothetical protein